MSKKKGASDKVELVGFKSFSHRTRKVITHCLSKHPWHHLVYSQRNPKKRFFTLTLINAVLVPTALHYMQFQEGIILGALLGT